MPSNPSETPDAHELLFAYAEHVADVLEAEPVIVRHGMIKAHVRKDHWVEALAKARDDLGLVFFSWLFSSMMVCFHSSNVIFSVVVLAVDSP